MQPQSSTSTTENTKSLHDDIDEWSDHVAFDHFGDMSLDPNGGAVQEADGTWRFPPFVWEVRRCRYCDKTFVGEHNCRQRQRALRAAERRKRKEQEKAREEQEKARIEELRKLYPEVRDEWPTFAPRNTNRMIPPSPYPVSKRTKRKYKTAPEQKRRSARYVILERDHFTCIYCGKSPLDDKRVKLHVDHVVPRSRGGTDTIDNLVTSCSTCNLSKSSKIMPTIQLRKVLESVRRRNAMARLHGVERVSF